MRAQEELEEQKARETDDRERAMRLAELEALEAIEKEREERKRAQDELDKKREMTMLCLNQASFNSLSFQGSDECAFCMERFELGQEVIALPCDIRHFFHSNCILAWSRS